MRPLPRSGSVFCDEVPSPRQITAATCPLAGVVGEDHVGTGLADAREDLQGHSPEAETPTGSTPAERAKRAVNRLRTRPPRVVRLRFGLEGGEGRTLSEVGQEMGYTREQARQVIGQAMGELRELVRIAG